MKKKSEHLVMLAKNMAIKFAFYEKYQLHQMSTLPKFTLVCKSCPKTILEKTNLINPNVRLTLIHTSVPGEQEKNECDYEPKSAVSFLDTLCSIKERRIDTDLYRKTTDRNQYLLPRSCPSKQTILAIQRSLAI